MEAPPRSYPYTLPEGDGAPSEAPVGDMGEMGFLDHLEELRWALIKALGSVLAMMVLAAFFSEWIIDTLLLGPSYPDFFMYEVFGLEAVKVDLQNRTVTGQFFAHLGSVAAAGVVLGSPLLVYFIWKFVEPGLYPTEKKGMRFAAAFATLFFIFGLCFGYLIITPLALQFFAQYSISPQIVNEFDITRYFSMVTFWSFGVGLLFELPVVIYFLAKLGLATPEVLRRFRKFAVIIVLILGALFTPPDPVSQVLVATPLLILYELSIFLAALVERRRNKALAKEAAVS